MTTVNELIADAYYLGNVVSRDLGTVAGSQLSDGLRILNQILSEKSMSGRYIPYYGHEFINTVSGQEFYTIPNLIITDAVTFNIGTVRYAMRRVERKQYFGTPRVDNIESLPYEYYVERELNGSKLYLYFLPLEVYRVDITGKFALQSVTNLQDLDLSLDGFYQSYLTYLLAKRLCEFYNQPFGTDKLGTLRSLEDQLNDIESPDLRMQKYSTLGTDQLYNWGDINLGHFWR